MKQQIPAKQSTKLLKRFFQMMGIGMNSLNFSQPSMTICLKASHHSRIFNRTTHRSGRYSAEGFPLSSPTTIPKPESRREFNVRMLTSRRFLLLLWRNITLYGEGTRVAIYQWPLIVASLLLVWCLPFLGVSSVFLFILFVLCAGIHLSMSLIRPVTHSFLFIVSDGKYMFSPIHEPVSLRIWARSFAIFLTRWWVETD